MVQISVTVDDAHAIEEVAAGLRIRCPDCGTLVRVPMVSDPRLAAALAAARTTLTATPPNDGD